MKFPLEPLPLAKNFMFATNFFPINLIGYIVPATIISNNDTYISMIKNGIAIEIWPL